MDEQTVKIAEAVEATMARRGRRPGEADPDEKAAVKPKEEVVYVEVKVDLPPHAPDVRMDGRIYQPGLTYKVTEKQAESMRDIMYRAWAHEQEVRGERTGFGPKLRSQYSR